MSGPALYALHDVHRREAGRTILEIPELELPEGRIVALVGPNGAGKSTLLRVLALLDRPERGQLELRGRHVDWAARELVALRREITLVEQAPYLFRGSVLRNVAFGLVQRGVPRDETAARVAAALARVDLAGSESLAVRGLSGGEARRVAIARALAIEPRVLLLDEPFANVDRHRTELLEGLTRELSQEHGTSVVVSTHDISQAHALADRVVSLADGRIVRESHDNLFSGTVEVDGERRFLRLKQGRLTLPAAAAGRVSCTVSPAAIQVGPAGPPTAAENRFTGRIVRLELRGERARLRVEAGELFRVELPVENVQTLGLTVGTHVALNFPESAVELIE